MAKIPFDIKYRPQIESGEYKVVTSQDYPVQILKWDADNLNTPIFFSYTTKIGEYCTQTSGDDLFIVTPEPELSEFEKALEMFLMNADASEQTFQEDIKKYAGELLVLARKELVEEQYTSDPRKTDLYKLGKAEALKEIEQDPESSYAFKRGVEYGKEEVLKNLPRWKNCDWPIPKIGAHVDNEGRLIFCGRYTPLVELTEKLPGFKED